MAHYKGAATEATRAMNIMKKREKAREELELKKRKIEEGDVKLNTIDSKFSTHHYDSIESQLRSSTVGLVTLDQMREKQETALKEREKQLAHKEEDRCRSFEQQQKVKQDKTDSKNRKSKTLSFNYDDDDEEEEEERDTDDNQDKADGERDAAKSDISKFKSSPPFTDEKLNSTNHDSKEKEKSKSSDKKEIKLNVSALDIDTSFLPDKEREEEERLLREKLAAEWLEQDRKLKEEEIEITFSYWDGSGHRRMVRMKKGNRIYDFLHACLETLRKDFNELRNVSAEQLMYVKEDLIIPHLYTFHELIVRKARGKSGPLFSFDVHDDVRLIADATVEKDESHAGKVMLRSWYERNKHIFPASRWETYDPHKDYEKYTISDKRN